MPASANEKSSGEQMDFETALEKLEEIVSELESGQLGLEQALKRFEEAMKLKEICERKLREAEAKIEEYTARAEAVADQTGAQEEGEQEPPHSESGVSQSLEIDLEEN